MPEPNIDDLKITPEILDVYFTRQNILLNQINDGIIVINSNTMGYDGGRHRLKSSNYFYYLTGFDESNYALMLSKNGKIKYSVFYPERDMDYKTFNGEQEEITAIQEKYKFGEIIKYSELNRIVEETIESKIPVYVYFSDVELKNYINDIISKKGADPSLLKNITPLINEMRVKKDELEIKRLQKAIDITGEALVNVYKTCKPGMYEFEMEAIIEYNYLKYGASMPGFNSIVGAGKNSTILHYEKNNEKMKPGDLLLMDIGAEYDFYTADITRTIPVNGKFSKEQKVIYELILRAQKAAIAEMKPGNFINSGHFKASEIIIDGLFKLGLITDPEKEWQRKFYTLYPTSHYLGMNVHDVGDYGKSMAEFMENRANTTILGRPLEPGMVLTIEPGLYFRGNGLSQLYEFFGNEASKEEIDAFIEKVKPFYEKYKNIGIRIEDDILITASGNKVLSAGIPKEIADIEKLMK
jgi:Xaa-Pro aminopeptidase